MAEALTSELQIEKLARDIAKCRDVLYLGRGTSYPLAAGRRAEMKENLLQTTPRAMPPASSSTARFALIDENMPVVGDRAL